MTEADSDSGFDELTSRMTELSGGIVPIAELRDAWGRSEEQLKRSRELGVKAMSFYDDNYPARLRDTRDPPAILFTKGNEQALHEPKSLAIVGTREPTNRGMQAAQRCGRTAAKLGYAIVSGLALGCDTLAHKGCLEARGIGIAVLAHGLDSVYPVANRELADRLLENDGCLVSEYPIETRPVRPAFAERNRIQSGLSDRVLVIETGVNGGTMHTARFAWKQERPLACIDRSEQLCSEDKTMGNRQLIDKGWALSIPNFGKLKDFLNDPAGKKPTEQRVERDRRIDKQMMLPV